MVRGHVGVIQARGREEHGEHRERVRLDKPNVRDFGDNLVLHEARLASNPGGLVALGGEELDVGGVVQPVVLDVAAFSRLAHGSHARTHRICALQRSIGRRRDLLEIALDLCGDHHVRERYKRRHRRSAGGRQIGGRLLVRVIGLQHGFGVQGDDGRVDGRCCGLARLGRHVADAPALCVLELVPTRGVRDRIESGRAVVLRAWQEAEHAVVDGEARHAPAARDDAGRA